ncbi:hypothetical protein HDK77DRAFT_110861 [Phyllosticta capitalensis]
MQCSPSSLHNQSYPISPNARRTGFAIQQLQLHEGSWVHSRFYFYSDNQRWGLITDGSRPMCSGLSCSGTCLYVETPGRPDDKFHSSETVKYKLVILRCLACEATNSVCDGQIPCDACFRNAVDCFPYSELVDDNFVWSRWTAMPHARIHTEVRFPAIGADQDVQLHSGCQGAMVDPGSSAFAGNQSSLDYQAQSAISDPSEFFQSTPSSGSASTGASFSASDSRSANVFSTSNFAQRSPMDLQALRVAQKRARREQTIAIGSAGRNKRARANTANGLEPKWSNRPISQPRGSSRQNHQWTGQSFAQPQHQLQMPTPEPDLYSPYSSLDLDQELLGFEDIRQDSVPTYGDEFDLVGGGMGLPGQADLGLSPPTETCLSSRSLSPCPLENLPNRDPPSKPNSRRRSKPQSAPTNAAIAACPGTRTGGGRYDGATYDAPPPSVSLPLRNCNLTAIEVLTYLPKHAWSHPDICMRLVDNDWGDSTMADYITITRGRRQLKNSIGKSITGIGKAKYPYFRELRSEELAQLGPEYGTASMPGEGFATNAFAAGTPRPNPKTTSEWRVKLHRKISRPPQHSLATDGFAPGKTSIFMWELATGVLPDKHPQGFDALDLTRCVRLAVEMRGVRDWLFPDDWDEVLTMAGGPALVTREHLDAPALARWKTVRDGLSHKQLCKEKE